MDHSASATETAVEAASASSDLHAFTSAQLSSTSRKGTCHGIHVCQLIVFIGDVSKWSNSAKIFFLVRVYQYHFHISFGSLYWVTGNLAFASETSSFNNSFGRTDNRCNNLEKLTGQAKIESSSSSGIIQMWAQADWHAWVQHQRELQWFGGARRQPNKAFSCISLCL